MRKIKLSLTTRVAMCGECLARKAQDEALAIHARFENIGVSQTLASGAPDVTPVPTGFVVGRGSPKVARGVYHASVGRRGDAPTVTHAARATSTVCRQRWKN